MSALPPLETVSFDTDGINAWRILLSAETAALQDPCSSSDKYKSNLVGVRTLGWFMKDFWDHRTHDFGLIPYNQILREIMASATQDEVQHKNIFKLGLMYRDLLAHIFRPLPSEPPPPSSPIYPPLFDTYREDIILTMGAPPKTMEDAEDQALLRDGFKCQVSGLYDLTCCRKYPELRDKAKEEGMAYSLTQCTYLFPNSARDPEKDDAFTLLMIFGLGEMVRKILGGEVNSLRNTLTLTTNLHDLFNSFTFWLEEVEGQPHTYKISSNTDIFFMLSDRPPRQVTFKLDEAVLAEFKARNIRPPELPNRTLIAIRAVCARVAHASGTAEQIEQMLDDEETTSVFLIDGSSVD